MSLAERLGLRSLAFPLIGAGSGGFRPAEAERIMLETFGDLESDIRVVVVRFRRGR
jgi:O-acetyl-ADP-ribose deacetylase (regulator of RNase III)